MKKIALYIILSGILISFQSCTVKSNGHWKSQKTNLELHFDNKWELIIPNLDTESKTMVGVKDHTDNSSFVIKITDDVPKEQLSDEDYLDAIQEQMINASLENKLLVRDKIEFKEAEYNRLIFSMKTKFGKMIHTVYTHRNGSKVIGIQFSYPEGLIENPSKDLPYKIERILVDLKF